MPRSIVRVALLMFCLCGIVFAANSAGVWLDVPFIKQDRDGCGAASIAMVMQYWQHQQHGPISPGADAAHILRVLHSDEAHGIYASAMVRYFQQSGYRTFAFSGAWADLQHHIAQGRPLIAALKPDASSTLHYVVVAGIDPVQDVVMLNDPEQRKLLKEDRKQFEQEWKATNDWTLLAVPASTAH